MQAQCVGELNDPSSPEALNVLKRQIPILESLHHRLLADALECKRPQQAIELIRIALQTHQALERTLALLRALASPKTRFAAGAGAFDGPDAGERLC
ncbi:MAG: hypothetical protein RLY71_4082 [Pseudomonadota bacterium]